jgi:multidrug efflux system outer membrane protein
MNGALQRSICLSLSLAVAGCAVGPDYERPATPLPERWIAGPPGGPEWIDWWRAFDDPKLAQLVERAIAANTDLRVADARVLEARALRRATAAPRWPWLDAGASYDRVDSSDVRPDGDSSAGGARDVFAAGVDALYEIDVFGGLRRSVEAADADVELEVDLRRGVFALVVGEVAVTYVELRGAQRERDVTLENLAGQRDSHALTAARARAGLASDLDVERSLALAEATAAEEPLLDAAIDAAIFRLALLLGETPEALVTELAPESPIPVAASDVALGVPADLLRRRPDVRAAERALAAATARIGESEAELYPRFQLIGSIGGRGEDAGDVFTSDGLFWSIGPRVSWPILHGGRIRALVDARDAQQAQALASYEGTLLRAVGEVETAHARWRSEQRRHQALDRAVIASRRSLALAQSLHARGFTDFLGVLVAERSLLEVERQLARSDAAISTHLVALYVALGGGWEWRP